MIGGTDIVIPTSSDRAALDVCARTVQRYWPQARFEDALTGEKYPTDLDLPAGSLRELFVYRDAGAEAAWDRDGTEAGVNTLIYLIASPKSVTAVVDDPSVAEMRGILESLRITLGAVGTGAEDGEQREARANGQLGRALRTPELGRET